MNLLAAIGLIMLARTAMGEGVASGTATGNLVVDGKAIPLKYCYVVDVDNVEESDLRITFPRRYFVIVLSDREIPPASVCDRNSPLSERVSMVQMMEPPVKSVTEKMYGIVLKIDPRQANPLAAELKFPNDESMSMNVMGAEYPDRVNGLKVDGSTISGVAEIAKAKDTGAHEGPKKYSYHVSFHAPIVTEPAVTENLVGKEALESAQVTAIKAYIAAGKSGDVETLRKYTATSHIGYLKKKEVLDYLKGGDVGKIAEQVKRVVVRGKLAAVVCVSEEPNYSQVTMHLINENGGWKLQWP